MKKHCWLVLVAPVALLCLCTVQSFANCSATMQVVRVSGVSSAEVNDFPTRARDSDGPNRIDGPGTTSAASVIDFAGTSQCSVSVTAQGLSFRISGSGTASVSNAGGANNRTARAGASGEVVVRAVGGDLRIRGTRHSVSMRTNPQDGSVETVTEEPRSFDDIVLNGEERSYSASFICAAMINIFDAGGAPTTGNCFIEGTAEPWPSEATTFFWTNSAGGAYHVPANWNPNCAFPVAEGQRVDTAIFGLPEVISVSVQDARASFWRVIQGCKLNLSGSAGAFSPLANQPSLLVEDGGSLRLTSGSTFESFNARVGSETGLLGADIVVKDNNSHWKNTRNAIIGSPPPSGSTVQIENGGLVETSYLGLGEEAGLQGRVEVSGIQNSGTGPSRLEAEAILVGELGGTGTGSLTITNGGMAEAGILSVVRGMVTVAGQHGSTHGRSTLKTTVTLSVEGITGTQLEVKDGGLLDTRGAGVVVLGKIRVNNSGTGQPPYDEADPLSGAVWLAQDISLTGQSELIVEDNGVVLCSNEIIAGHDAASTGNISVSDGKIVAGELKVGGDARGFLRVEPGGAVETLRGSVGSGADPSSRGFVGLRSGPIGDAEWTVAGDLTVGGGPATGLTALQPFKGEIRLEANLLAGLFSLSSATLKILGQLTVDAHGAIYGNGTLDAPNRSVINGGFIGPGLSPGKLRIQGNYEQTPAGRLVIEVAGLQEGQFDVLEVIGNATLNGTLEVRFLEGFLPRQGQSIEFLNLTGALSNNFAQIIIPQAAPGFDAELNLTPEGKLRIVARNDAVAGNGATITSPPLVGNTAVRITQLSANAGQLTLAWTTTPGRHYRVEAKDNLNSQTWTAVSTDIAADGSSLSLSLNVSDVLRRFYRVAQVDAP